ncbi:hypothetical protein DICPUDRAFT_33321 [Dictyostelium purpureum]|uniref:Calmodulin n=1 Tax=Dictyostelium purpureum TaxID=5786 RepID=F0ZKN4_DICPU|nr:uncharacterized protein DICPUDRAFT_33321 [Dictyostelium purpureum]EGC35490.1 hypothetical protein DICPUDRAFT_33321 [Dictyostelium purpureum]|eukprot:XP_003287969.1 hypothetical protein DICPUDRAFT_33321 [Dictyostelium purpureum]
MSSDNKNKRKDAGQYIETRNRKKAREALDLITNSKQRQASLFNLLGTEYTGPSEAQLEMMFRLFDTNRDGKISGEELKGVIRAMGKRPLTKRIDKILAECDTNGKGYIEMDEFVRYMQKKAAEKAKQLGLLESSDEEDEAEDAEGGDTDEEKEDTPKRKAAGARPKKRKAASSASSASTNTTSNSNSLAKQPSFFAPIKKGSSIVHFYTENAGTHKTNVELDKFNNPTGLEHDLGLEGAFTQFTILIGKFYKYIDTDSRNALKSKGFNIVDAGTQKEFVEKLPTADIALIVSNYTDDTTTTEQEFVDAVKKFHESGKGLFVWYDNHPYTFQGNWVSKALFGIEATGNEMGKQELSLGTGEGKQQFSSHLITTGINNLYEGVTISSFAKKSDKFETLATSSEGNTIILVSDPTKMDKNCGRVVLDTGFTKLFSEYFTAGTSRYIKNACVWLLALDGRFNLGVEVSGAIPKPIETPVWQFEHGGWLDYDNDASKVVEEAYQEWLLNPNIDVRSVKSGHWAYQIDFKHNTQTNIQHFSHTSRNIRRIMKQVIEPQI